MVRFAIVVVMLATACKKETPRYEGPLRVQLGDCAGDAVWVSGPRPLPPESRVAKKDPPKPDEPKPDEPKPDEPKPDEDPAAARQRAIEQAREAGIIGTTQQGGAFATLTGTGDISSGFDDTNIYGGLLGNEAGEMNGGFGYGRSGFGPGGGGTGWGTIGTGRYGTIGQGTGYGVGGGRGGMRGRSATMPTVSIGQPNAQGDLDKAIIRRYIKRNIQKLQYCYEKELLAKPKLAGTVQTQFFIAPTGMVAASSATGVDPEVASCVANVIKAIEFPKPKGGGGVQVNYPFTFRPAGDSSTATQPAPPISTPPPEPPKANPPKIDPKPEVTAAGGALAAGPYTPGKNSPLIAQRDAFEECFRTNSKPYGAVTVKLDWTGNAVTAATVHGVSDKVAECVAEMAKKVTRTSGDAKSQTCSIAFGAMPPTDLPGVEITAEAIKLEGSPIADPRKLDDKLFKIDALYDKVTAKVKRDGETAQPVSIVGPLIVRPHDLTPIAVVNKVLSTIYAAGGDFLLAASDAQTWRILNLVDVPVVPVPRGTGARWSVRSSRGLGFDDEKVTLSILVQKDQIWVGLSRVNEFQPIPMLASKEPDWDKLEMTLKQHKASAFFADRTDLEIGGELVTWIDIVHTIDIAKRVGFLDFQVFDPAALTARPTL